MQMIPLLQIIFYLATLFLPAGTARFTLASGYDQKITWVRQADGAWRGTQEDGKDAGLWSVSGLVVSVTTQGKTEKTDVTQFVKVAKTASQEKQVAVLDHPVTTTATASTLTFSQDKDGLLAKPVVLTIGTK